MLADLRDCGNSFCFSVVFVLMEASASLMLINAVSLINAISLITKYILRVQPQQQR